MDDDDFELTDILWKNDKTKEFFNINKIEKEMIMLRDFVLDNIILTMPENEFENLLNRFEELEKEVIEL